MAPVVPILALCIYAGTVPGTGPATALSLHVTTVLQWNCTS